MNKRWRELARLCVLKDWPDMVKRTHEEMFKTTDYIIPISRAEQEDGLVMAVAEAIETAVNEERARMVEK